MAFLEGPVGIVVFCLYGALLCLLVLSARRMGKRLLAVRTYAMVFLVLGILPLPSLSFTYNSIDANPHPGFTIPLSSYLDLGDYYLDYVNWARIRGMKCLTSVIAVHISLSILIGVWIVRSRTRQAAPVMRDQDADDKIPSLVANVIICSLIGIVMLVVILPNFMKARSVSCQNWCINNLRQIDSGKEQAALIERWGDTEATVATIVNLYIKGNTTPVCPGGGVYSYGRMNEPPRCDFVARTVHKFGE